MEGDKITHIAVWTLVEDTTLVGAILPHSVLHHNLHPALATRNEREVWPQSLRNPIGGRGLGCSCHLLPSILNFVYLGNFSFFKTK
jgi:hypothetical protein